MGDYAVVTSKELEKMFVVESGNPSKIRLSNHTKPVFLKLPFVLDENVATLAGMMPDGSLIQDLMRCYFHQKKDPEKIVLFRSMIDILFCNQMKLFTKADPGDGQQIYFNSKTLAWFFHYMIDIPKSRSPFHVPAWVFSSPRSVKVAYLKQAFDMEGTVLKKLTEIRFAVKDKEFASGIQQLLGDVGIYSSITYCNRSKHNLSDQYRVSIYRRKNFERFKEIGFRVPFLKDRFESLLIKYKLS